MENTRVFLITSTFVSWALLFYGFLSYPQILHIFWLVDPLMILGFLLLFSKKKVFSLGTIILYLYGLIFLTSQYIGYCNEFDYKTFETCGGFILRQLLIVKVEFILHTLEIITVGFLIINLFRKKENILK